MMNQVFTAIAAFFSMITTLCNAGDKGAKALDELAGVAHESAASFHDEAKHNRAISQEEAEFKRDQKKKELAALKAASTTEPVATITKTKAVSA